MTTPRPRRLRALRIALAVAWVAAFVATHIPAERVPTLHASDKVLHMTGYALLAGLFWVVLAAGGRARGGRVAIILIALAAYAAVDELTQPLVNRVAALDDWLFDLLGAAVAVGLLETLAVCRRTA